MSLYNLLVVVHVLSAILGLGPGFVLIYVVKRAQNMTELRHGFKIRTRLHVFVMVGGTLLLLTGLLMGYMNQALFHAFWYVASLSLFLVALGFGPIILSPRSKPIKEMLKTHSGETIPEEYYPLSRKLFFYERVENVLFIFIIFLMITKPYSFEMLLRMLYLK